MNASIIILLAGAFALAAGAPQATPVNPPDGDGHFLNPTKTKEKICKAPDGRDGICVDESTCSAKYDIDIGGNKDVFDLRIGTCKGLLWCCVHPNMSMFITEAPESSTSFPQRGLFASAAGAPQAIPVDPHGGGRFLDPTNKKEKICKTPDGREGICVDSDTCSEKYDIELGGNIGEYDIRSGLSRCEGDLWCCVHPNMSMFITEAPESSTSPPQRGCRTGLQDSCPWCVAVYRNNPSTHFPQLHCGGAVVGSRFVLTSASCALAHKRSHLWVELPGSTIIYSVHSTIKHKQFNSGTREHDMALLVLNKDVEWPEGRQDNLGACLALKTPLQGNCVAIGFDDTAQLKFTPVTVTANSCNGRGTCSDVACGRAKDSCVVAPGSPVLCPTESSEFVVAGLVRQTCIQDATLLGSLMASAEWVTEELTKLALAADRYTIT